MNTGGVGLALVAVLAVSSNSGCRSKPIEPENRRFLREARALWAKNGPSCYEITEDRASILNPFGRVKLTVCGDRIAAVRGDGGTVPERLAPHVDKDWTVVGLFALIERDVNVDPVDYIYDVVFDPQMGFPKRIAIYPRQMSDAGVIVVDEVVAIDCARCGEGGGR